MKCSYNATVLLHTYVTDDCPVIELLVEWCASWVHHVDSPRKAVGSNTQQHSTMIKSINQSVDEYTAAQLVRLPFDGSCDSAGFLFAFMTQTSREVRVWGVR